MCRKASEFESLGGYCECSINGLMPRVVVPENVGSSPTVRLMRGCSSARQSSGFQTRVTGVQISPSPLYRPVTSVVTGKVANPTLRLSEDRREGASDGTYPASRIGICGGLKPRVFLGSNPRLGTGGVKACFLGSRLSLPRKEGLRVVASGPSVGCASFTVGMLKRS